MNDKGKPPAAIEGKCGNCAAWYPILRDGPRVIGAKPRGQCMMLPPTPHPIVDRMGRITGQRNFYVSMREDQFCFQFVPRGTPGTFAVPSDVPLPEERDTDGN
jgi:hypothetical protein